MQPTMVRTMAARSVTPRIMPRGACACGGGLAYGRTDHHDAADDLHDPVMDRICGCRLCAPRCARSGVHVDGRGRFESRMVAAHRYAHGRDAGGREYNLGIRAPLLDRLHARRPVPAPFLRLSVDVHLRHADAGDGGQSRAAVLRLGRRRACELSADRLLVSQAGSERGRNQGVHRQPGRRLRFCAWHFRRVHADRRDRSRHRVCASARL